MQLVEGLCSDSLPAIAAALGGAAAFVLLDHAKECYLPDLQALERLGLVAPGTVVVADNVVYPGAPGYLEYVGTMSGRYDTELLEARGARGGTRAGPRRPVARSAVARHAAATARVRRRRLRWRRRGGRAGRLASGMPCQCR